MKTISLQPQGELSLPVLHSYCAQESLDSSEEQPIHLRLWLGKRSEPQTDFHSLSAQEFLHFWQSTFSKIQKLELLGDSPEETELFWHILDFFGDLGQAQSCAVTLYLDLNMSPDLLERFIMKTHYLENLTLQMEKNAPAGAVQKLLCHGRVERLRFHKSDGKIKSDLGVRFRPDFWVEV